MPSNLQSPGVRCLDRGAKVVFRNVHISFERSEALIGPVVHKPSGILLALEDVHLKTVRTLTSQERRSSVCSRPWTISQINVPLDVQVRLRLYTACCADGRNARSKIQTTKT